MRVLKFPAFSDAFELANTAIHQSQMRLTIAQMRTAARVLDKFEPHAQEKKLPEGAPAGAYKPCHNPKRAEIRLEEAEHELLKKMVEETPWLPGMAKKVVGLVDLLEATPEEKGEKKK